MYSSVATWKRTEQITNGPPLIDCRSRELYWSHTINPSIYPWLAHGPYRMALLFIKNGVRLSCTFVITRVSPLLATGVEKSQSLVVANVSVQPTLHALHYSSIGKPLD